MPAMISQLSDWIFKEACTDMVNWHNAGFKLRLSINLSPHQLNNEMLAEDLIGLLERTGIDPNYLTSRDHGKQWT